MQIVCIEDNLHGMSNLFLGKIRKKCFSLSSAEVAQRVVKVNSLKAFFFFQRKINDLPPSSLHESLSMLGKIFSRRYTELCFFIFLRKRAMMF